MLAMFCSCSCEEGCSVAALVSNRRRSKSNQVSVFAWVLGSLMNRRSLFSTPFCGMLSTIPSGSEVWKNAPRFAAPLAMALPAWLAALLAGFTALFTELPRLKNQSNAANKMQPRMTAGHMMPLAFGRTSSRTRETSEAMFEGTLESPGMENPAGRQLRSRGNSADNMLPSPDALRPSELSFDASVPSTIGAAEARMVPAADARMPEISEILF